MKKAIGLGLLMLLLTGCNFGKAHDELSFSEVAFDSTDKDVQKFIADASKENGVYLYDDSGERWFVYLNAKMVEDGQAAYFTDFDVKGETDTVNLFFEQKSTDELDQQLKNQVLYEVKLDKPYDYMNLFKNNAETSFHTVSGSN